MNKTASSQPAAAKFRSLVVIILVLICITVFLAYTDDLSEKASGIARDRVLSDIRYSLAMMLYDYTVKGKQLELKKFDRENPFVALAIYRSLPVNYRGVVAEITGGALEEGWYFDKKSRMVVYVLLNGDRQQYVMRYLLDQQSRTGSLRLKKSVAATSRL